MPDQSWTFPDVEALLAGLLAAQFLPSADHAGSTTPANLADLLPFCQVIRYGGGDDGVTDQAAVDVDWFAGTRTASLDLARRGHQYLIAGRLGAASSPLIDSVASIVGPIERPRATGGIRRFGGSYTVNARRAYCARWRPRATTTSPKRAAITPSNSPAMPASTIVMLSALPTR